MMLIYLTIASILMLIIPMMIVGIYNYYDEKHSNQRKIVVIEDLTYPEEVEVIEDLKRAA